MPRDKKTRLESTMTRRDLIEETELREQAGPLLRLPRDVWSASSMLDRLGLPTMETYQCGREDLERRGIAVLSKEALARVGVEARAGGST